MRIRGQAARSIGLSASFWVRLCHPFTLRIVIWPEASSAQNTSAAVWADGSTVWVLIRRLNSSWSRSIALVVRALFHWLGGSRVKVKSRSPQKVFDEKRDARPVCHELRSLCPRNADVINIEAEQDEPTLEVAS